MATLLIVLALLAFLCLVWFFWPTLAEEIETARRLRRIDQIRRRTLADMTFVREQAWQERDRRARQRLDRIVSENDL